MKTASELRAIVDKKKELEIAENNRKTEDFLENKLMPQLIAQAEQGWAQVFFPIGEYKLGIAVETRAKQILRENGFNVEDQANRKWKIIW